MDNGNIESFRVEKPGRSWQMYQDKPTRIAESNTGPQAYTIDGNYPNPFNPDTTIKYSTPREGLVQLSIYNVMGQKVRTLMSRTAQAGNHSVRWDGKNDIGLRVSSGVYVVSLRAGSTEVTHRMTLMR